MTKTRAGVSGRIYAYGAGDIGANGSFYIIGLYFTVFLTQVEGIPVWWVGLIVLAGKLVDAVTDPLMGSISDRTASRFGRHRVYFIAGFLPLAFLYMTLFYSFNIPARSVTLKALYYLITNCLFSVIYTLVYVPYTAMLPTLSGDYDERTRIVGIRNIFSCIGCVLPYFVSIHILGSEYSPVSSRGRFMVMGLAFGLFFALSILITFIFVKEEPSRKLPGTEEAVPGSSRSLHREYASLFQNRSYRIYLLMLLSVNCMSGMIIGSYFYYTAYVGAHFRMYGQLFFFHGLTEIAGLPLVYLISRKFGKQLPFRFTMPVMVLGLAGTMFISPAAARPWMLYVCALLIGFGVSGIGMVSSNLYSDLTDVDELIFGKRREGICSGVSTFLKKLVSGLSIFFVSAILGGFGYRETPTDWDVARNGLFPQTPDVITGTRLVFAIIPAVLAIITFVCTFFYPVDAAAHRRIQEAIAGKLRRGRAEISREDAVCFERVTGLPPEKLWAAR